MVSLTWEPHPNPYNAAKPGKGIFKVICTDTDCPQFGLLTIHPITGPYRTFMEHVKEHNGPMGGRNPKVAEDRARARNYAKGYPTHG